MTKAEAILNEFIKGDIVRDYDDKDRKYHTLDLATVLEAIEKALQEGGSFGYSEDDLREAFYKGREQACLPDEKATRLFIRPTFNGYLRELDGKEDPHANFKLRVDSLINNKDYDKSEWEDRHWLQEIQKKVKKDGESS